MSNDRIRVLFLAADPFTDRAPLQLGEEVRAIDHAIQRGTARDALQLVSHFATRTRDLQEALLRHRPRIVHFSGHADQPGVIYLGDEHGRPRAVDKQVLGSLFGILSDTVRMVVLNGCDTLPVVEVLSGVVDYAIGMDRPVTDASAIAFAEAFYRGLAFGQGVRTAFDLAVVQLRMDHPSEAVIPVLRVREGVDPQAVLAPPAAEHGGEEIVYENPSGRAGPVQVSTMTDESGRRVTFRNG
ncbi:MAG TPA: CHAT domain-containing protein [Longimicrobium sp.]|nr:CHAT domain-containing protein [Longimicrobium sp.]